MWGTDKKKTLWRWLETEEQKKQKDFRLTSRDARRVRPHSTKLSTQAQKDKRATSFFRQKNKRNRRY